MKRLVAFALLLSATWIVAGQGKPDFSGSWLLDKEKSELKGVVDAPNEELLVIRQAATQVTVEKRRDGKVSVVVYPLDGSTTVSKSSVGGEVRSGARWDGDALVTISTLPTEIVATETRTLSADGGEMTVQLKVQQGGTGLGRTLVYRKQ